MADRRTRSEDLCLIASNRIIGDPDLIAGKQIESRNRGSQEQRPSKSCLSFRARQQSQQSQLLPRRRLSCPCRLSVRPGAMAVGSRQMSERVKERVRMWLQGRTGRRRTWRWWHRRVSCSLSSPSFSRCRCLPPPSVPFLFFVLKLSHRVRTLVHGE